MSFIENVNSLSSKLEELISLESIKNNVVSLESIKQTLLSLESIKNELLLVNDNKANINSLALIADVLKNLNNISESIVAVKNNEDNINAVNNNELNINSLALIADALKNLNLISENIVSLDKNKVNILAVDNNKSNINTVASLEKTILNVNNNELILNAVNANEENINIVAKNKDAIILLKDEIEKLKFLYSNYSIYNSNYENEDKIEALASIESTLTLLANNITTIQKARENADKTLAFKNETKQLRDEAEEFRNQAQTIAGGEIIATNVKFADLVDLETYKTNINIALENINTLLVSDNTKLDEIQEIVDFIKLNKTNLENLGIDNIAGLQTALSNKTAELIAHKNDTLNPHNVTKNQLGLENVNNTADLDKPLSTAAKEALSLKSNIADIVDNLISTLSNVPLSANQGRVLKEQIRTLQNEISSINTVLQSDDSSLDELQELVNYIKQNKSDLQNLTISNIAGLAAALNNKAALDHTHTSLQNKLLSGTNIKTINGVSLLGSGNLNTQRSITDSVALSNSNISASAKAVKTAYDKAVAAYNTANNSVVSTSSVLNANKGATAGSVGSYIFGQITNVNTNRNDITSGSNIRPAGINISIDSNVNSGSLSGTWRCMGHATSDRRLDTKVTLWLRIS